VHAKLATSCQSYQIFVNQLYTSIKLRTNLKLKKFKVLMKDSSYGNLFHYTCNNMQLKIIICTTKHLLGMHLCIFLLPVSPNLKLVGHGYKLQLLCNGVQSLGKIAFLLNTVLDSCRNIHKCIPNKKAAAVYNHGQPILNLD
jgi:hypothetical protein